jgi:hypothetical protein
MDVGKLAAGTAGIGLGLQEGWLMGLVGMGLGIELTAFDADL